MKEYASDLIRNVAVVSHDGAGKTALVESLLLACGAVQSVGKGQDNKHIMDFEPEEIKRNVTIQLGMAPCEWKNYKINFIDTPGYSEFHGEVRAALRASDGMLMVLSATSGVEVDTNVAASDFFGSNLDVLNTLNSLSQELQNPDVDPADPQVQSDIQNAVDVVDTASDDLNASIASLGETQNTMSMLSDAQTDISTSNDELIGSLQDLDYGPASITFTGLEVAMEATLKTYSKVSELNLFSVL